MYVGNGIDPSFAGIGRHTPHAAYALVADSRIDREKINPVDPVEERREMPPRGNGYGKPGIAVAQGPYGVDQHRDVAHRRKTYDQYMTVTLHTEPD